MKPKGKLEELELQYKLKSMKRRQAYKEEMEELGFPEYDPKKMRRQERQEFVEEWRRYHGV